MAEEIAAPEVNITVAAEPATESVTDVEDDYLWLTERLDAQNRETVNLSQLVSQVLTKIETNPNAELLTAMEAMRTLQAQTMEALTMTQRQLQQMSELVTLRLIPQNSTVSLQQTEPQAETVTIAVVQPEDASAVQTAQDAQQADANQKRRRRL